MIRIRHILILFIILYNSAFIVAQTPTDSAALRALQVGYILPPERVYLHFDNTAYFLGETIWFKAFVTCDNNDQPTTLSRVLYVELVAPEGYVVKTNKYKIDDDGTCNGEIYMDPLYLSGYYEVRAYTRYMLNWGDEAIFSRVFPVFDKVNNGDWGFRNMLDRKRALTKDGKHIQKEYETCNLKFYPESGHLVENIETLVAYELTDKEGMDICEEISIFANNRLLLKTSPLHLGKGVFKMTPRIGVKYHASVKTKSKTGKRKSHSFSLPQVESNGVVINTLAENDSIRFRIVYNTFDSIAHGFAILHRSKIGYYNRLQGDTTLICICKNDLPEGVSRAIVFRGRVPLAERMFFIEHDSVQKNDKGCIKLRVTTNGYKQIKPYEKIIINAEREDGKPLDESIGIAISASEVESRLQTSWGHNLYTYLLLGSEIKGYIPDAWQYFDPCNKKRHEHLDLIMLTHGWTAYNWRNLTTENLNNIIEPEKGITIRGTFYNRIYKRVLGVSFLERINKVPYCLIRFDLANNNNVIKASTFRTDSLGRFTLQVDDFYGKRIAAFSPITTFIHSDRINYTFSLDRYFSPKPRRLSYYEITLKRNILSKEDALADSLKRIGTANYLLTDVTINASKGNINRYVPPISELRLDYLDEWEYATDVTFLSGIRLYKQRAEDNEKHIKQPRYPELDKDTTPFDTTNLIDGREPREDLYQYRDVLTASDVVYSAHKRYNIGSCHWIHFQVIEGAYNKDSLQVVDHKYLHGINVEKITNFKELIITSNPVMCRTIEYTDAFKRFNDMIIQNKLKFSFFYEGFFTSTGIDSHNLPQLRFKYPDRMAYFIPHTRSDSVRGVIPDLSVSSSTRRYTSLQGYTPNKQFYSPDYSMMQPDSSSIDYRRTLLWIPNAKPVNGKLTFEFYNNSQSKSFFIDLAGYNNGVVLTTDNRIKEKDVMNFGTHNEHLLNRVEHKFVMDSTSMIMCEHEFSVAEIYYSQKKYSKALTRYMELLKFKYAKAFRRIGEFYLNGIILKKNTRLAKKFLTEGAELGDIDCYYELSELYRDGIGVEQNRNEEINQLQIAAKKEHPSSLARLGKYYNRGIVVEKDSMEAKNLLRKAAMLGNTDGLFEYGICLHNFNIENDSVLGTYIDCIKSAAGMKHIEAMQWMMRHEESNGNQEEAYRYAKELYLMKDIEGTMFLAGCYMNGYGCKRNKRLAKDLYREAAAAGSAEAKKILEEW